MSVKLDLPEVMTAFEVATLMRVSEKTVRNMVERGELNAFYFGNNLRFTRAAVLAAIESANDPDTRARKDRRYKAPDDAR